MYRSFKPARKNANLQVERLEARDVPASMFLYDAAGNLSAGSGCGHGAGCTCAFIAPEGYVSQPDPVDPNSRVTQTEVFSLHSRPGASKRIFLDFDGAITAGTAWNSGGPSTIVTPAFDIDNNPNAFTQAEIDKMYNIWERTVEFFSLFDVDVTTEQPTASDLDYTGGSDTRFGVVAQIGGDGAWYGTPGVLGVAHLNSFGAINDQLLAPAFVFSRAIAGNPNNADVAYVIAHELGHTFGLQHDGFSFQAQPEYYGGHNATATAPSWAPVMGNGFGRSAIQWSEGEYAFATNTTQDDIAIIAQTTPLLPDDVADSPLSAATILAQTPTAISGEGVINGRTDLDIFRFTSGPGMVTINANQRVAGGMLDVKLELLDFQGNVLATSNPDLSFNASISTTLATGGDYYIRIDGVGKGTPGVNPPSGYSDYGSVGQYTISGTVQPYNPPPVPDPARVTSLTPIESTTGTITGFRVKFNTVMDLNLLTKERFSITGPTGAAIAVRSVKRVDGTLDTFDVATTATRFSTLTASKDGGFRLFLSPEVKSLAGTNLNQNNNGVFGEILDYYAGAAFQFNSTTAASIPSAITTTDYTINVPRTFSLADVNVRVNATYPATGSLKISLVSPGNVVVPLFTQRGGTSSNLTDTRFDDLATLDFSSSLAVAPFRNTFKPDGVSPLSVLNGTTSFGAWKLRVETTAAFGGSLNSWGLTLTSFASTTPLAITSALPVNDTTTALAKKYTGFTVNFNTAVNPSTLTTADVRLITPSGTSVIPTSLTFVTPTQVLVKTPLMNKLGNYTLQFGPNVTDIYGNLMDGNLNGRFNEKTGDIVSTVVNVDNAVYQSTTKLNILDNRTVTSTITIPDNFTINSLVVEVNALHTATNNLRISLISPDNLTTVQLFNQRTGTNLTKTVFADAAVTSLATGPSPYTGAFDPEQSLSAFTTLNSKGVWKLRIEDVSIGGTGQLQSWALYVR
jgi:subtilisin-like proprotein convertase family protein